MMQTAVKTTAIENLEPVAMAQHEGEPVIIIGTGPVGVRVAKELMSRNPDLPIVQYGAEPWMPYNRVKLSSLLAGEISSPEINNPLDIRPDSRIVQYHNCAIVKIDPAAQTVVDSLGREQRYRKLILAVGSRPHIPNIDGVNNPNIFTFRDLTDVEQLLARRVRSRRTVVIGGGLLGLEAARAMQRNNTEVVVVEHNDRLMQNQLDDEASEMLREYLLQLGIKIYLGAAVKRFSANGDTHYLYFANGKFVSCDTVIIATGIKPNVQLAMDAGLHVGRGIKVNDFMQTNDANIYAVGECAEHNGKVYGLVAPGFEQAAIAAHHIMDKPVVYPGTIAATWLKVLDKSVFSVGVVGDDIDSNFHQRLVYTDTSRGIYRALTFHRSRIVGAVAIGEWAHIPRIQEAVTQRRWFYPWQLYRFRKHGELWPDDVSSHVSTWPANAVVCNCAHVTRGEITAAIEAGHNSMPSVTECTGASSVCGSCKPLVAQLLDVDTDQASVKIPGGRTVAVLSVFAFLMAALITFFPALPPTPSVQEFSIAPIWEDSFWKQVTGYSLLGLTAVGLVMSLRKRWRVFRIGDFNLWRMVHVALGVATLLLLVFHTGLQFGSNLNFALMATFIGITLTGALAGAVVAAESKLAPLTAKRARSFVNYSHLLLFWPFPVLIGFHIVSFYYF